MSVQKKKGVIESMLKWDIGGPGGMPPQGIDPDTFATQYAQQNGISVEEAKQQLKARFGDPAQRGMSMDESIPGLQFSGEGATLEFNPYGGIPQDPAKLEQFVEKGARQAGCTPQEFAKMMGIPDRQVPKSQGVKSTLTTTNISTSSAYGTEETADDDVRLSSKDKKEWIKNYRAEHNCSKKEAKEAFKQEYEYDVMSRKDAKAWIKDYMSKNNCSKKEAKKAFREKFGYNVPLSTAETIGRALVFPVFGTAVALGAAPVAGAVGLAMGGGTALAGGISTALSGALTGTSSSDLVYRHKNE